MAYAVGSIMALGALFAAVNSMHSSVASRKVEIATLRALGFASLAVAVAVLLESVMLALIGAAAGVAVAYAAFNGTVISTLGGAQYNSQLVYALIITPMLAGVAVVTACALGLAGAVPPAIQAATGSVAEGLRETWPIRQSERKSVQSRAEKGRPRDHGGRIRRAAESRHEFSSGDL